MHIWKFIPKFFFRITVLLVIASFCYSPHLAKAQSAEDRKPIDLMLVVDNSCSMFPEDSIVAGCEVWGNDPGFLRIAGVNLFVARLGFAEVNELEYQAGVISLGRTPTLVAPLQPVSGARDTISRLIANPPPELGTNMMAAIKLAYQELRTSPNRRPMNLPAVVLLTDGRPYPAAGQSDAAIEQLVSANPDIPFFIMLLQDPNDAEYERYVRFWEQMQSRYDHIFTYHITDQKQIEETYNQIIAQLQNTVPGGGGIAVTADMPHEFFVSQCVQEIVVTVQHKSGEIKGDITILNPKHDPIELNSASGVKRFRGTDNPVEVISIGESMLTDDLKDGAWTITSDKPVTVHLDRRGAYNINFVAPDVSLTDITNVYLATERQTPSREFNIRFQLTSDCYGSESQPIWGDVIYPDGQQTSLRIPDDIVPDSSDTYEIHFDFASAYPAIMDTPGHFIFILNAGSALGPDDTDSERVPIATTRLLVDVGRAPYIDTVSPQPLICETGKPADLTVSVGDVDLAATGTLFIRAFTGGTEMALEAIDANTFSGDLSDACATLLAATACDTRQKTTVRLRLAAQLKNGNPMPPTERSVPVEVVAPPCPTDTPMPTATPTPTPPPLPTPIPDTDHDGFRDPVDECPTQPGIELFAGCPIPWWGWLIIAVVGLAVLAFVIFWLIPWIKITISPPPKGYVLICRRGHPEGPRSIYSIGKAKRANRVTIGGDRKAHIHVSGLKPGEFYVVAQGEDVKIFDAEKNALKGTFRVQPSDVSTSDPNIKLRVGLDNGKLNRC